LKITGRKKELIVMSTGKNVAPALIENLLKEHHLISHALVFGEGKSYLVAVITLNPIEAAEYARARGIEHASFAELTRHPDIISLVRQIVDAANARVSSSEAIRKFVLLDRDFQIEADEVTPTMKLKRNVVTERFSNEIQRMYAEQASV
jgi:long-chain acyl-CoA synthetase